MVRVYTSALDLLWKSLNRYEANVDFYQKEAQKFLKEQVKKNLTLFLSTVMIKIPPKLWILIFPNVLSPQESNQPVGIGFGAEV